MKNITIILIKIYFTVVGMTLLFKSIYINDLIVDIGSNDGLLVKCYRNEGFNALGVDPDENLAKAANEAGIPTLNKYFDESCVETIIQCNQEV